MSGFKNITVKDLAGAVCEHLAAKGIVATLVGGSVVTIYTTNKYLSMDLDFATGADGKLLAQAMKEIGFVVGKGKYLSHPDTDLYVEFVNLPVAVGSEIISKPDIMKTARGALKIMSPTDIVKDRLLWWGLHRDRSSLEQAIMVSLAHRINWPNLKRWVKTEKMDEAIADLQNELQKAKRKAMRRD